MAESERTLEQQVATLVELLRWRAQQQGDRCAYTFLVDGETQAISLTYFELEQRARAIAGWLQTQASPGDRALLLYPPGLDYISAFFGCLYAGVIAVPAYPPHRGRADRTLPRLRGIARSCQPTLGLTTEALLPSIEEMRGEAEEFGAIRFVASDLVETSQASSWREPELNGDNLAFLQYTSGSTGMPKGVMVSHGNLLHNTEMIRVASHSGEKTVTVSWLPFYHDMGLIGNVLKSAWTGGTCVLLSAVHVLQKPFRWLDAISRYRGTYSGGPNFSYELCVEKITPEQREQLDLSSWNWAFNGAEPVRQATLDRFATTFAPHGFRAGALAPSYGLAEGTLMVSACGVENPPQLRHVRAESLEQNRVEDSGDEQAPGFLLTSSGRSGDGQQVLSVDPSTKTICPPDKVGEIWVCGPSVAHGYWCLPEETAATFQARLADGTGPFLRTGDLGFIQDGNVFVTGRLKDLIIVRGRNHYPQDIELTAEQSHNALRPGCCEAFSIDVGDEERVVVVQEVEREHRRSNFDEVQNAMRRAVAEQHEIDVYAIVLLKPGSIPKTSSGKLERRTCRAAYLDGTLRGVLSEWKQGQSELLAQACETSTAVVSPAAPCETSVSAATAPVSGRPPRSTIEAWLRARLAERLGVAPATLDTRASFSSYAVNSKDAVGLSGDLEDWLGCRLSPTLLFEYPSMETLAAHLAGLENAVRAEAQDRLATDEPIAIVGIGCRFPGASGPEAFWGLLRDGQDAIQEVPVSRWNADAYYDPDPSVPGKMNTRWGGFLEDVDRFDPQFFGIAPREAARMDPQQRLLMEVVWEALEDAGQTPDRLSGSSTGVFVGISNDDYGRLQLDDSNLSDAYAGTGSALSIAANRLSYFLNLRGPSLVVDTACSSSLAAVHLAARSLSSGECDLALVGGVNLILSPNVTVNFSKAGFMAPDGRCKAFDARANGYVRSEGCGVVVLKPLSRAQADGDTIYALIRGSAVNQDGRSNGLTAPNPQAQESVLQEAYRRAGVAPSTVQYVEAHGTGTLLGDPIEARALSAILSKGRAADDRCRIGSVKTNIGHLESAAGIAGLIKVALCLQQRTLPPSLHFEQPNPHIPFDELQLQVQTSLSPWPAAERALAGVSAFGFGGTNVHVVLEGAPAAHPVEAQAGRPAAAPAACLLPLSAASPEALQALARSYRQWLSAAPSAESVTDICYSASVRRGHREHRLAVTGRTREELAEQLDAALPAIGTQGGNTADERPKVAFVFSGQGPQWWGMGRELLVREPVFRACLERCDELLRQHANWSLLAELAADEAGSRVHETQFAQPALFAVQVGLARLWQSWGIQPDAVVGHSLGEIAAAHLAGILSLDEALRLVCHRGRLMQQVAGGKMASVELSGDDAERAIAACQGRLVVAATNGPTSTVLSGDADALDEVVAALERQGTSCRRLRVDAAFHSAQMDAPRGELIALLQELRPNAPVLPMYSTVTGGPTDGLSLGAEYWGRNLREPVRFAAAIGAMVSAGYSQFIEIGPHPVLSNDIQACLRQQNVTGVIVPSLRRGPDERLVMLNSLGALYVQGQAVEWKSLYPDGGCPVRLPQYPWQRERYWLAAQAGESRTHGAGGNRRLQSAGVDGTLYWETDLEQNRAALSDDYQVQGTAVVPASAWLEMTAAAAEEILGRPPQLLADVEFKRALFLAAGELPTIQIAFSPAPQGEIAFQIFSRPRDFSTAAGTLHVCGTILPEEPASAERRRPVDLAGLRAQCSEEISADDHYVRFRERGLLCGPPFQGIERIWRYNGQALGKIRDLDAVPRANGRFHPGFIDACFQVLQYNVAASRGEAAGVYLPTRIDRVRFHGRIGSRLWGHSRLRTDRNACGSGFAGDVQLLDAGGEVVAEFLGLHLNKVEAGQLPWGVQPQLDDWLYELSWQHQPRQPVAEGTAPQAAARWLLFADRQGVAARLAESLRAQGGRCWMAYEGSSFRGLSADEFELRPDQAEDLRKLLQASNSAQSPLTGIVHLWSLDSPAASQTTIAALDSAQRRSCGAVVELVRELSRTAAGVSPRVWLVTQGAQCVGAQPAGVAVSQSPLWGLGRVAAQEHPDLRVGLVDLDPAARAEETVAVLQSEICDASRENQIAFRQGQRHVARLVRRDSASAAQAAPFRLDGAYLITGGLGDLGLLVARWMAERGARRLILTGRTRLSTRASWADAAPGSRLARQATAIRELESLGATVELAALDVADEFEMKSFLAAYRREGRPAIRGVVHAAGVLNDRTLVELRQEELHEVLRPKVQGAWLLHRLLGDDLDFCVLFSSAASVFGSPGQGNYAAGNAFLDALAAHRRALGLPATSINWGPWSEVGMAARDEKTDRLALLGVQAIAPRQGLDVLERLWGQSSPQTVVVPLDWRRYTRRFQAGTEPVLTCDLVGQERAKAESSMAAEKAVLTREALLAASPEERPRLLESFLRDQAARVLGFAPSRLDVRQSLNNQGLDSLMAVELRNRMEAALGLNVPVVMFLQGPSVQQLAGRLAGELTADHSPDIDLVARRADPSNYPLSLNQQALWFLNQLLPNEEGLTAAGAVRIQDELDLRAMRAAVQKLVDRHAALRTVFVVTPDGPVQRVQPQLEAPFETIDVSTWTDASIGDRVTHDANRAFHLERGPVARVVVYSRSAKDHVLLLSIDHLVVDFWSLTILFQELGLLYAAERDGMACHLDPLEIGFGDYVHWQRELAASPQGERHWEYWRGRLSGELPVLNLPLDHPRPPLETFRSSTLRTGLDARLSHELKTLAESRGATLYTVLLAGYQALLSRYSGQDDVLVGSVMSGRTRAALSGVVGYLVNPVALRGDLSGNPSFVAFLDQVRTRFLEAVEHQDYPIVEVVQRLKLARDSSRSPLFQTMFVLQKAQMFGDKALAALALGEGGIGAELGELHAESVALDRSVGQFDLTLMMAETDGRLVAAWSYNPDLFAESTIARMAEHFRLLLEHIVAAPDQPLASLPLLTPEERGQIGSWNATRTQYPLDRCIHQCFEAQAARTPDAVALTFEGRQLTYRELDRRANQLAHYLRRRGVGPETLVGICTERSFEMVIGLYGILKAGGAYVPLDPEYPADRLAFMLADSDVPVLLTQERLMERLPALNDPANRAQVVRLDADWEAISREEDRPPACGATLDNLAYAIFTSGSTGKPKGAMNSHRGILNRLMWMQDAYGLTPADCVLQKTPFSFDVSVWEFFWPLMFGSRLAIARPEGHRDAAYLTRLIESERVTTMHFVPSMLQVFLEEPDMARCCSLRRVIVSGEALSPELERRFFERLDAELHNLYGPTEAAVDVTYWPCQRVNPNRLVPIGRPIANIRMHVLDKHLNETPVGVAGELHIAGVGLGRGYLNRPALTSEKFIAHPVSDVPGDRLYKTGDLARWRPDGTLEYLGRIDHQVKIRGFRIELGEIEAELSRHPGVREAVVVAREDLPGHKRLVAYLVPAEGARPAAADLRVHLQAGLPEYMVPATFVVLDAMPLGPSGKTDRRLLPAPDASRRESRQPYAAPRDPVETELCTIWSAVLRMERVGINDNFFELGGDSIIGIQIIARSQAAGIRFTPKQLFLNPTIGQLAAVCDKTTVVQAEQGPVTGPAPLTPIQHWFFEQARTDAHHFNQAVLLETLETFDAAVLERAIEHLLAHHDALRLRFRHTECGWEQTGTATGEPAPFERVDLSEVPPARQAQAVEAAAAEIQASLDLGAGPLLRAAQFDLGRGKPGRLLLVVHHLAIDGVSWRVLIEDLLVACRQLASGQPVALPPKSTSYKAWGESLRAYSASADCRKELGYWLDNTRRDPARLLLDDPEASNIVASAETIPCTLSAEETRALLEDAPKAYRTGVQQVMLAALIDAVGDWSGSRKVLVDLEGHGREDLFAGVDLSRTVGWFTSLYPMLFDLTDVVQPGDMLKSVKEQLAAVPQRGLGYGVLKYLSPDAEIRRRLRNMPESEICFNYLGQFDQVLPEGGPWRLSRDPLGPMHSLRSQRTHALEVTGLVSGGKLQIDWTYSTRLHRRATMKGLAQRFVKSLRALIEHCRSPEAGGFTPSDFPRARLNQKDLERFLAKVGRASGRKP